MGGAFGKGQPDLAGIGFEVARAGARIGDATGETTPELIAGIDQTTKFMILIARAVATADRLKLGDARVATLEVSEAHRCPRRVSERLLPG